MVPPRTEERNDPLAEISALLTDNMDFADWIDERRCSSVLRNDDVTLIVVDVN
jgi:hypothetical protein